MYSIDIKDKLMIGRRNLHERIFNRKRIHGAGRRQIYVICFRGGLPGLYGRMTGDQMLKNLLTEGRSVGLTRSGNSRKGEDTLPLYERIREYQL